MIIERIKTFSKSAAVERAWETLKPNFWFLTGLALILIFSSSLTSFTREKIGDNSWSLAVIVLVWIVQIFLGIGVIFISLKLARGQSVRWSDLWEPRHVFWRFLGGNLVYGLIVLGGFVLLVAPGIIWSVKYQFFAYAMIDRNLGIMDSLKESGKITQGHKWNLLLLNLLLTVLTMLGIVLLFVGTLVAIPITWLAMTLVYLHLTGEKFILPIASPTTSVPTEQKNP